MKLARRPMIVCGNLKVALIRVLLFVASSVLVRHTRDQQPFSNTWTVVHTSCWSGLWSIQ